jgi:DNA-binding MarR family transcriptional regulator
MPFPPADDRIGIPALMRAARGSYAQAIRAHLAAEGIDDIPRNGAFVLSGLANGDESVVDMIRGLGVTKQAVSQLIDTLVLRGYLTRDINPEDRRRMTIDLTDRGRAAAAAICAGTAAIDDELARVLSPAELAGLRAGLAALGHIKERMKEG